MKPSYAASNGPPPALERLHRSVSLTPLKLMAVKSQGHPVMDDFYPQFQDNMRQLSALMDMAPLKDSESPEIATKK